MLQWFIIIYYVIIKYFHVKMKVVLLAVKYGIFFLLRLNKHGTCV